jgi:hypothetical protein
LFPDFSAIALEGAKGVGKTATASQRAATILSLSRPEQRETLSADLDYVTQVPTPVLIDEWQLMPAVWDRVPARLHRRRPDGPIPCRAASGIVCTRRSHGPLSVGVERVAGCGAGVIVADLISESRPGERGKRCS